MLAHTHIALSIAAAVGVVKLTGTAPPNPAEVAALIAGSLLPDIDSATSAAAHPGRLLSRFLPRTMRDVIDGVAQLIALILNRIFGHRGFLHWPILALLVIAAGLWLGKLWLCWLGFGYLLHILGDMFTPQGAPILAPIIRRRLSAGSLRTGSAAETLVCIAFCIYASWAGFELLPAETREWLHRYAGMAGWR